jgi:hypothetical protein
MREMLANQKEILKKLDNLERKDIEQDKKIILISDNQTGTNRAKRS